jgi:molecular chaperone Hsp33
MPDFFRDKPGRAVDQITFTDKLWRFSFEQLDIRGELVYLDESWKQVLARHDYPETVRRQLGEALAAVCLLGATIKFEGNLILQIQGKGPMRSLVVQITSAGTLRGLARWEGIVPDGPLGDVFGDGNMLITVMKDSGERYQSIVELAGNTLADALELYFRQSEQLPTSLRLFVSPERVAGLFLQMLPETSANAGFEGSDVQENWTRINLLADTLRGEEIFRLEAQRLLHNLFHEEELRLFEPVALRFECTCSRAKVERTLVAFGRLELDDVLAKEGSVKVDCEFCNMQYSFDAAAVAQLFEADAEPPPGSIIH